jgi:hypothetical protein
MKKLAIAVASSSILLSGVSFSAAKTGIVVGGQVGYSELQNKLSSESLNTSTATVKNGNITFGGIVGYDYALMKNFSLGLESGMNYNDQIVTLNDPGNDGFNLNNYDVPLLLTAKYYFGNFSLFAKAGYAYKHQKLKGTGTASNVTYTMKKWVPVIGGGLGYDVMKNLTLYAQYTSEFGKNINDASNWDTTAAAPTQVFASYSVVAGVTYTFGM